MIESLSLIDAVMPDVVESRKAAAAKIQQIKTETNSTNGDESSTAISKYLYELLKGLFTCVVRVDYRHCRRSKLFVFNASQWLQAYSSSCCKAE